MWVEWHVGMHISESKAPYGHGVGRVKQEMVYVKDADDVIAGLSVRAHLVYKKRVRVCTYA